MRKQPNYHKLALPYQEFESMSKNISYTSIGKYFICQKIGQGSFGKVYKGMDDESKLAVAVKVIDLRLINQQKSEQLRNTLVKLAETQDKIMSLCDSDYVIKCFDVYENRDIKILFIEYCNGGTLFQYINDRTRIPQKEAILILKQILNGIAALHSLNIIHRDLKAENILIQNGFFKIADFGLSTLLPTEAHYENISVGTLYTMAPEVLSMEKYNIKADIWSVGVIFYLMLFGEFPFKHETKSKLLIDIRQSQITNKSNFFVDKTQVSEEAYDLLKLILVTDQQKRIGWKQLLNHKIFNKIYNLDRIQQFLTFNTHLPTEQNPENSIINLSEISIDIRQTVQPKIIEKQNIPQKQTYILQNPKDEEFLWLKSQHNECLKSYFIFEQVICKVQRQNLLDFQKREVIQFMYLLATRCFLDLSPIQKQMKIRRQKSEYNYEIYDTVQRLYIRLKRCWQHYLNLLTELQNKIINRLEDFFQFKTKIEKKNRFMNGIEKIDYSKDQQLKFIVKEYMQSILISINSTPEGMKVKDILLWYRQINLLQAQVYKKCGFENYIRRLIQH